MRYLIFLVATAATLVLLSQPGYGDENGRRLDRESEHMLDMLVNETVRTMGVDKLRAMMKAPELPELPSYVDCFGLPSWIATPVRNFFRPSDPKIVNTRFYLATRTMRRPQQIKLGNDFHLEGTGFDPSRRTVMIVHGFLNSGQEQWIDDMTNALLDKHDVNVFAVDWSGGGGSWKYWKAVANTRVTGDAMTRFVKVLMNKKGVTKDNLHLIGHSLGAHICGFVSRNLGRVGRITGLDPAQPCFRVKDPRMTLDKSDADFVDVVHTNGKMLSRFGLGLPYDLGDVDFYPNGGMMQPNCSPTLKGSIFLWIKDKLRHIGCSHGRAYMLFTESIRQKNGCKFWGHRWDMTPTGARVAMAAPCVAGNCSEMGFNAEKYSARGSFYVQTSGDEPFCLSEAATVRRQELFIKEALTEDAHGLGARIQVNSLTIFIIAFCSIYTLLDNCL